MNITPRPLIHSILLLWLGLYLSAAWAVVANDASIRVIPLPMSPPISTFAGQPAKSIRANHVAKRLQKHLHHHTARAKQRVRTRYLFTPALPSSPLPQAAQPATASPAPASASRLRVALHAVGTPRQLKRMAGDGAQRGARLALQNRTGTSRSGDEDTVRAFLWNYRDYLRLDHPDHELQIRRKSTDELGRRHFRFAQRYRGLPVWPAELIVHLDPEGRVDLLSGSHIPTPRGIPAHPAVGAATATATARRTLPDGVPAKVYASQLIVYAAVDRPARLAWKIELDRASGGHWRTLVDALSGQVLAAYDTAKSAAATGSGLDLFGAYQTLQLWEDSGKYFLLDTSKPMFDSSSNPPNRPRGAIQILDAHNFPATNEPEAHRLPKLLPVTSQQANSGWLKDAVSAAANFSLSYDYYVEHQQRNSVDGTGGGIRAVVRLGVGYDNAFWSTDNQTLFFGDGEPFAGALDVIAHELTHGVNDYSVGLEYLDQSGALDEAFADIFGEMVEAYADGGTDWIMGSHLDAPIRNLRIPSSLEFEPGQPYPTKMSEYLRTVDDNGGVHTNATIFAHAYYLLAEGLEGAIGLADAERIFYRALTVHLTSKAQFADARLACIEAAEELFGAGSIQAAKTGQVFDAVEIFEPSANSSVPTPISLSGEDALVFVYFDAEQHQYFLGRRESRFSDPEAGVNLSWFPISKDGRPTVSADGAQVLFVNAEHDLCFMDTDGNSVEDCLGIHFIHAAVMSPDGYHFAYLQLDETGNLERTIYYYDGEKDYLQSFDLRATASEGQAIDSIVKANALDISLNNRYLVYDALNILTLEDGSQIEAWSIYAFDLYTGARMTVVPPVPGYDLTYPSLGRSSNSLLVFEATEHVSGKTYLHTGNLITGDQANIAQVANTFSVPVFGGDDLALLYTAPDAEAPTGFSLWRLPLAVDHMSAAGEARLWLSDGILGSVYRRGALTHLRVKKRGHGSGGVASDFEGIDCGVACSALYAPGTIVTLKAKPDFGFVFDRWGGVCRGKKPECHVTMRKRALVAKARFIPSPQVRLKVRIEAENGNGRVTSLPSGIDCGTACRSVYVKSSQVTLTAQPDANSVFAGWGGACKSQTGNQCLLTLKHDRKAIARFQGKEDR